MELRINESGYNITSRLVDVTALPEDKIGLGFGQGFKCTRWAFGQVGVS